MKPRIVLTPSEADQASASEFTIRYDLGVLIGLLVFGIVFTGTLYIVFSLGSPFYDSPWMAINDLIQYPQFALRSARSNTWRITLSLIVACVSTYYAVRSTLKPRNRIRHIDGAELLEGLDAEKASQAVLLSGASEFLRFNDHLAIAKSQATRHFLISGSVGSGKTQIIAPIIRKLIDRNEKAVIYDVKGDFTSMSSRPVIISPWDARSASWDLASDITTDTEAQAFAQSLIPNSPNGTNEFFTRGAQGILVSCLYKLMRDAQHNAKKWGWPELSQMLLMPVSDLHANAKIHYPEVASFLEKPDSTTTNNVIQTLAGGTSFIHRLAVAWKNCAESISFKDWCSDDYAGKRQIILQAGGDAELSKRYISAVINVITP